MKALFPILIGLLAFSTGCEPTCEKLAEGTPSIEIGTGVLEFVPIANGDVLRSEWGDQGGQHLWSSLQVSGVRRGTTVGNDPLSASGRPAVRFALESGESVLALYFRPSQVLSRLPDGRGELLRATSFISLNPYDSAEFFPEDFDPENWKNWEEGEVEAAWAYARELVESMDWTFSVTLTDSCGTEVSDSRTVRIEGLDPDL
jgi:hypothetical protein